MASDKPQSKILDLLYDDELDAEARDEVRRAVDQSDEARQELESFESMLSKIRDVDLEEDVPTSVHDSIMAAAREHTAKKASRQAQVTERSPNTAAPREKSLWSRLNSSGVAQLAMAAAVVLVGGFIFVKLGSKSEQRAFQAAEEAVHSEVTFGGEETEELAKMEPSPKPTESPADEFGQAPAEPEEVAEEAAEAEPEAEPAEKAKIGELAQLDTKDTKQEAQQQANRQVESKKRAKARAPKAPTRKARSRSKKSKSSDMLDLFGNNTRSGAAAPTGKSKPQPRKDRDDRYASAEAAPQEEAAAPVERDKADESSDSAALGQKLGSLADDTSSSSNYAVGADDSAVAESESKPVPAQAKASREQQTSQVSTMESDYRSGNYAGVVTQADRYLARSSGQKADEARVLELKARALAQQGKTREADEVYAELQKKYPSYRSAQIERERRELAEKRKREVKKRRRAPSKRSYDFESEALEKEAAEPASVAPASAD
ncbi:hypothetical protein FIV42_17735 [Persicimonas caeni]|uniref:Tetratricopeptide repeat protein n=1 Tax=Persicimonas caeni TaxID=2292766 RepID=A0A4Y6PWW1_PERCE|nr:hypothetical protein [Persicimonas caeni]QDG52507.1 hypothetical protein FIV42_17735 [Persicimonas caeni]QED33729.1 hypothetical protein FRD00_17730 [Persicimonas caeni]